MAENIDAGNEGVDPQCGALYARVSSDGQNELTLEEQKAAVLRFAEAAGYDVIASYVEDVEDEEDVD